MKNKRRLFRDGPFPRTISPLISYIESEPDYPDSQFHPSATPERQGTLPTLWHWGWQVHTLAQPREMPLGYGPKCSLAGNGTTPRSAPGRGSAGRRWEVQQRHTLGRNIRSAPQLLKVGAKSSCVAQGDPPVPSSELPAPRKPGCLCLTRHTAQYSSLPGPTPPSPGLSN